MKSSTGKQTIAINMYPNISRSKDNQTMKNHTQNVVEKQFPDSFLKNQNWAYDWIISLTLCTFCFYGMLSHGDIVLYLHGKV